VTTRRVSWRRDDEVATDEWCSLSVRDAGLSLVGTIVGVIAGLPLRVEYRVLAEPDGATAAVHVRQWHGFGQRSLALQRNARGSWTIDGNRASGLRGATDVDLGITPSTNTLPIRRLRLRVGASKEIRAAWVRFPELTVEKASQRYSRIDEFTYRYLSGAFEAELTVDDDGLVGTYAVWRRTGLASGGDDSEPLDAAR
jgi:hypothetical protein